MVQNTSAHRTGGRTPKVVARQAFMVPVLALQPQPLPTPITSYYPCTTLSAGEMPPFGGYMMSQPGELTWTENKLRLGSSLPGNPGTVERVV